ncbi:MAG: hypothetical protein IGS50_14690 [Synechococcales cyanobacterium C42_A2020_086]|jgi:hypothetical protein|nr:hypothetical protein [Synechococcales cyanobacterium M58_A2018_015]MBF2074990.1 hypothetical protein [Synechococcales cyanobacterium C42_A2020_086]
METLAYTELSQDYATEQPEVTFSAKKAATFLGVAATLSVVGLVDAAPALATYCCRPRPIVIRPCCRPRPIVVRPCCRPIYY